MTRRWLDLAYLPPLGGLWFWERLVRRKKTMPLSWRRRGFPELPADPSRPVVWVHGVSVGEVAAAKGVIEALRKQRPGWRFVITSTTVAGLNRARELYPEDRVSPSPLDFSGSIRRAMTAFSPAMMVFVEGDLWPNWLSALDNAGVPVAVINGKLSERSCRRYRMLMRWAPRFFASIDRFLVQNQRFRERWLSLGVDSERVRVSGNLKVDNLPARTATDAVSRRSLLGWRDQEVWLAGSTHEGEERVVLDCHRRLREDRPELHLVLAPRHLERLVRIEKLCAAEGFSVERLTEKRLRTDLPAAAAVTLVDTMGELAELFAAVDLVFLGGSLVPVGGHNLLEPAAEEKALLFGPRVESVREIADALIVAGAAREIADAGELSSAVAELLDNEEARRRAGAAARRVVDAARGASERTAEALLELMNTRSSPDEEATTQT